MVGRDNRSNNRSYLVGVPPTDIPRRRLGNINHQRTCDNLLDNDTLIHTTMKSSENFIEAIRQYLDSRAASDTLFAIRYASPSKSVAECCQYILSEVKRQGVSVLTNDEVYSLACHYFDGDVSAEEIGNPVNCKVVISKDQLTDEDKAELKEQAMEQYREEQLREIRWQSAPKAQPKATATAPKAGEEINVQPSLFDL